MAKTAAAKARPKKSSAPKKESAKKESPQLRVVTDDTVTRPRWYEFLGVALLAIGVLSGLALLSYQPPTVDWAGPSAHHNLIGPAGALLAELFYAAVGVGAYLLPLGFILFGVFCFSPKKLSFGYQQVAGVVVTLLGAATIAHISLEQVSELSYPPGGLVGAIVGGGLSLYLAKVGTAVVAGAALAMGILLITDLSITRLVTATRDGCLRIQEAVVDGIEVQRERLRARAAKRAERKALAREMAQAAKALEQEEKQKKARRKKSRKQAVKEKADALADADLEREQEREEEQKKQQERQEQEERAIVISGQDAASESSQDTPARDKAGDEPQAQQAKVVLQQTEEVEPEQAETKAVAAPAPLDRPSIKDPPWVAALNGEIAPGQGVNDTIPSAPAFSEEGGAEQAVEADGSPRIVAIKPPAKRDAKKLVDHAKDERPKPYGDAFELPALGLLDYDAPEIGPIDPEALNEEARKLVKKFRDYGIEGHVREIRPGPVVTTYEFVPAAGTRIAKIASLADDLAMAMEAIRVRVVAPIPGKGAVGIEIPNERRQSVFLKEIISSKGFQRSRSKLAMALGKDIEGRPYHVDLAKMPHMLVAGTTGSGKSVAMNAMITSILYKSTPEEVRFLMIDPKMLELSIYDGIPHLLLPPVTDPKKAAMALRWAVEEMERRYQMLAESGVRDIAAYNRKLDKMAAEAGQGQRPSSDDGDEEGAESRTESSKEKIKKVLIRDERPQQEEAADDSQGAQAEPPPERLPFIVVVVDEFADLMMVAPRDVETYIARLAQKARACGIHLLLATQRPSTDVITGVIKANFPVRMSFQVASNHDSKTIINAYGAEKLLGKGDMLLIPPGTSTLVRCHGAYISDVEIKRLVDFLKTQGAPHYDEDIVKGGDDAGNAPAAEEEEYDEHYDAAVAIVAETRQVSISLIQRRLKIGYNRAARIVDCMEREGLVGPQHPGKKPREVFIKPIDP